MVGWWSSHNLQQKHCVRLQTFEGVVSQQLQILFAVAQELGLSKITVQRYWKASDESHTWALHEITILWQACIFLPGS
jgi:hypothetical protein